MDATTENLLTLKRHLGLTEDDAKKLIDIHIDICHNNDENSRLYSTYLKLMLEKTFHKVTINSKSNTSNVEVMVNEPSSNSQCETKIFVNWDHSTLTIDNKPIVPQRSGALYPSLLMLGAAYTCGAVITQSTPSKNVGLGEKYPISLNFDKIFGQSLKFLDELVDLGEINCAGMGATGTWFVKCLEDMNVKGKIEGYDGDYVSNGNLQRTTYLKSQVGMKKVLAYKNQFNPINDSLYFVPHPYNFPQINSQKLFKKVVTCVDSRKARRNIQDYIPKFTFDCSTTDVSEVSLFFGTLDEKEPCLSCLYYEDSTELGKLKDIASSLGVNLDDLKDEKITRIASFKISKKYPSISPEEIIGVAYDTFIKELCGQGKLQASEDSELNEHNLAPLCHISAVAGILLAIETVRRHHNNDLKSNWNYWKLNPWTTPMIRRKKHLSPNKRCDFHNWSMKHAIEIWKDKEPCPDEKQINLKIENDVKFERTKV